MPPLESYRELGVWSQAMLLCRNVLSAHEQLSEARAVWPHCESIPANIAEGYGRGTRGSDLQFLFAAQGSGKELETHILLASRVLGGAAARPEPVLDQAHAVGRMLRSLIRSLQSR